MKLETFFEKFDQFADAPDAVAKMRELILRLAMQGKLVSQNPGDEPADSLVVELIAEASDKNGRRTAPLAAISPDDIPFELPSGWVWERLGNIGETNIGLTYSPQDVADAGTPVLRSSNVQNGKLDFDDLVRVTCEPKQSVMVQDGDLLICARNGSRALVGKVALIENMEEPAAFGAFMAIFRSRVNRFLYHFICSPLFRRMIDEVNTTTINQITQNNLRSTLAPLPPLAEQKRIEAKVDELMALCDRLEAQQQERTTKNTALARASLARFADAPTPANLPFLFHPSYAIPPADLRKSILTLAVQGKLVPQDPNDEPAEVLLARLMKRDVKDTGRRKTSQPDLTFTPDEIPFELPYGWAWERLGNIGETNIGLTYSPQDVSDAGIPVLRSSNIQNGKLDFDDLVRVKCEPKQSVMVQDGDLLICARNGSKALVGKVAVIEDLKEPAAFGAFMAIYRSEVNSYLYHFIRSPLFRQMIDEVNTTTINQITQNNLRSTLAPIPPLAEQRRIVAKVEQLMALVDALETQLAASRATAANLLSALVAELTAQKGYADET